MSKRLKIIIPVVGLAAVVVLAILFYLRPDGYRSIRIMEMGGIVTYDRGADKNVTVYDNMSLTSGDTMRTMVESFARMNLDDTKYVYMEQESEVNFVLKKGLTNLDLTKGAIVNEIEAKLGPDETYEVKTPNALMSVRGTRFRVSVYMGADGVYYSRFSVMEGVVESRLVYQDGSMAEETVRVMAGDEALVYYDEKADETDYVRFDTEGNPTDTDGGDVTRQIRYEEMPMQVLEYIMTRLAENPEYSDVSARDIEVASVNNSQGGEPVLAGDDYVGVDDTTGSADTNEQDADAGQDGDGNPAATVAQDINRNNNRDDGGAGGQNDGQAGNQTEGDNRDNNQADNQGDGQDDGQEGGQDENQNDNRGDGQGDNQNDNNGDDQGDNPDDDQENDEGTGSENGSDNDPYTPGPYQPYDPYSPYEPYDPVGPNEPYNPVTPEAPVNPVTGTTQNDFQEQLIAAGNTNTPLEVKDGGNVVLNRAMLNATSGSGVALENPINVNGTGSVLSLIGGTNPDERLEIKGELTVSSGSTANVGERVSTSGGVYANGGVVNISGNTYISGPQKADNGGPAITVSNGGTVNLDGGAVLNPTTPDGPAIVIDGDGTVNLTSQPRGDLSISGVEFDDRNQVTNLTYKGQSGNLDADNDTMIVYTGPDPDDELRLHIRDGVVSTIS